MIDRDEPLDAARFPTIYNFTQSRDVGFLNGKPNVATFFDYMGPWPFYLITLFGIGYALYAVLLAIAPRREMRD